MAPNTGILSYDQLIINRDQPMLSTEGIMLKTSSTDVNAVSSNLLLQQVGIQLKEFSEEYLKHETNQLRKAEMEGSLEALIEIIAEHTATNLKEAPEPVKEKTTGNVVQLFQR